MGIEDLIGAPGVLPTDYGANRVLVVDDDTAHRMALVRMLRKNGYECGNAMSTQEAREELRNRAFGLVVTDLRMFAEDGIELVRHVADTYPDTYSIVVSGFISEDDSDRLRRAGAFEQLTKPVLPDSFVEAVERAFDHRRETVALRRHRSG
jgi:DNA-binding NtrC family response regulator